MSNQMNAAVELKMLDQMLSEQRAAFATKPYASYQERVNDLNRLKSMLLEHQEVFVDAMKDDFGNRSADDSRLGDIMPCVSGIHYAISQLKKWMKPQKRHVGILFQPASARVEYQPLGVVGIMVPWNYPLFLAIGPLTAALAAGNHAMIKMSEFTPKTSAILAKLIAQTFNANKVTVVEGDAQVAAKFSSLAFDHLFFTGSTAVGKLVMKSAAANLVPVTLELGGKSPAIIDEIIDLSIAVERMILGKTLNTGQTCVAPDYVLCPKGKGEALVNEFSKLFNSMYPTIDGNKDYTSVVNEAQYSRLIRLLDDAEAKGGVIESLAKNDNCSKTRQLPLTLIRNVSDEMMVMQEEIFGPLLPIVEYDNLDAAIDYVNDRERPLALYVYSFDRDIQEKFVRQTHSGGMCINDAAIHVGVEDLPFGGVGSSGMGSYHGVEGFRTFSHAKSVLTRGKLSSSKLAFPPYGKLIHRLIYKFFIR